MKKLITLLALLSITISCTAQWGKRIKGNGNMVTTSRTVADYDAVSAGGSFDIKLVAGTEGKLDIYIDENLQDYLGIEVDGDKLKIKWKKGVNISHNSDILITVPFKDISEVALAGSGDIYSNDRIKASNFSTALSGSGNINLQVEASELKSAISGSGNISLSGSTDRLECAISGSGGIKAYDLASNDAEVRIAGSGGVKLSVKDMLQAKVSGSGNVYYKGNPKVDAKVSGSGSVSSK